MAFRRAFLRAVVLLIGAIALPATLTATAHVPAATVESPHPSASAQPPPVRVVGFADRLSADEPGEDNPGVCELASAQGLLVNHPGAVWVWDGASVVLMDRTRVVARCGPGTQYLWSVGPPFTVWAPTPGYLLPPSIPVPSPGCQWWQSNCENGVDLCSAPPADCATARARCAYPVGCPTGIEPTPAATTSPDPATTDTSSSTDTSNSTDTSDSTLGETLPVPDGQSALSGPRETPRTRPTEKLTPLDPTKTDDQDGSPEVALPQAPEVTLEQTRPGRQVLPELPSPDVTETSPDVTGTSPDVTDTGPGVTGSSPNIIDTGPGVTGSSPNITDPGGGVSGPSSGSSGSDSGGTSSGSSGPLIPTG